MHRMWSSKTNRAVKRGCLWLGLPRDRKDDEVGELCTITCRQRESSLSPVTSTSCKVSFNFQAQIFYLSEQNTWRNPTNLATPHPRRLESGSTRISCTGSITRKRLNREPSRITTVHAIRSALSTITT